MIRRPGHLEVRYCESAERTGKVDEPTDLPLLPKSTQLK